MAAPRARRVEVPRAIQVDEEFAEPNYASAFELPTPDAHSLTPEQWARATWEGAPVILRWLLTMGWAFVLGLRLGPRPSQKHVLGWLISDSGPDSMTLESRSRHLASQNIVVVNNSKVVWVTYVRFNRRLAGPLWAMAAPVHHRAIPCLLKRASRSATRG
jgi:Protein of unknown function (DUF2867)